jgi:DNA polymerase elongation subunit (family B)
MYKNFYYDRKTNQIHLWTDGKHNDKEYEVFDYKKYAYVVDSKGEHTTLTGLKVKKVTSWGKEAEKAGMVFEHDVPVSTRTLIDRYYETDDVAVNLTVLFFDIEVEKGLRYSTAKEAKNKITSIAYYDTKNQKYVCLLLNEKGKLTDCKKQIKVTETENTIEVYVKVYRKESELLQAFVSHWNKIKPDLVSSWNGDVYDIPYLHNRIENVLGINYARKLSPIGITEERQVTKRDIVVNIAGIAQMDYLQLYKKFTYNEESSYTLEAISQKELKRGKFKYDGTLDELYENDIDGFIEYNVNDVELIVSLDRKKNLIDTARGICHAGHVPYDDYPFSSKYLDGAALTYCKKNNFIAIRSENTNDATQAEGAMVKPPTVGIYKYVIDQDLTSLYPSLIRTLNVSPETRFGKVLNWNEADWEKKVGKVYKIQIYTSLQNTAFDEPDQIIEVGHDNFWLYIQEKNVTIASNGVMFTKSKQGLLPSILTMWFDERKRLSKLAEEYGIAGDMEKYKYYDQKQLIQKILLNSFYGVLLLPSFRFYNKDVGESITLTGQSVIQFSIRGANHFYNTRIKTSGVDYVIAGDTDSIFLPVLPLIRLEYDGDEEHELVSRTLKFATEIQTFINKSYDVYAKKLHNVDTHYLNIKQEVIAKSAFWGQAKKRYAMWIINKKGVPVEEPDIKGFDVVRSSFPKAFRKLMKELIVDILHDMTVSDLNKKVQDFKSIYTKSPLADIMLPTSVKEISKYSHGQKGTPIHIKSAQNYNKLLELHKIESLPPFDDGDKILYAYMRQNPYGFETMAIRGYDDPPEILEFVERFVDKEKVFNNTLISKLDTIWKDLGFGTVQLQEQSNFF